MENEPSTPKKSARNKDRKTVEGVASDNTQKKKQKKSKGKSKRADGKVSGWLTNDNNKFGQNEEVVGETQSAPHIPLEIESNVNEKLAEIEGDMTFGDIAEDFWESAWELCSIRFAYSTDTELIMAELRDTWLTIVGMQWLDSDPEIHEQFTIPESPDKPSLPPNFDSWSHGVLQTLPGKCRESVMDPFLREPLPWFMANFDGSNDELLKRKRVFPETSTNPSLDVSYAASREDTSNEADDDDEFLVRQVSQSYLNRPKSAMPPEYYAEDSWSTSTTAGDSFAQIQNETSPEILRLSSSLPISAASMRQIKGCKSSNSFEVIFPKHPMVPEIKASSEIHYKMTGNAAWKGPGDLARGSQIIAFKLPGQTSSQALEAMEKSKALKDAANESESHEGDPENQLVEETQSYSLNLLEWDEDLPKTLLSTQRFASIEEEEEAEYTEDFKDRPVTKVTTSTLDL